MHVSKCAADKEQLAAQQVQAAYTTEAHQTLRAVAGRACRCQVSPTSRHVDLPCGDCWMPQVVSHMFNLGSRSGFGEPSASFAGG